MNHKYNICLHSTLKTFSVLLNTWISNVERASWDVYKSCRPNAVWVRTWIEHLLIEGNIWYYLICEVIYTTYGAFKNHRRKGTLILVFSRAVPRWRASVAVSKQGRPEFNPNTCHLSSVLDNVMSGQVSVQLLFLAPLRQSSLSHYSTLICIPWVQIEAEVKLRSTDSWWVRFGVGLPAGNHDQIVFLIWQLRVSWCRAPSLTRGMVCSLLVQLLLGLSPAEEPSLDSLTQK
jgi:hypothetical protein